MRADFIGRVSEVRPNTEVLGANGDMLTAMVHVGCGGGSRQGCDVMVAWPHAKEWEGRKVRVTVEAVEQ